MKKTIIAFAALFSVTAAYGHTPAESNEVVSAALTRAAFYYDDLREGSPPDNDPPPTTWLGFLGPETNGWTLAGKMAAFDRYLSTLATNDCMSLDYFEQLYAAVAVGKCEEFNYTNSASAMKALALNPKGVFRDKAIDLAVRFGGVNGTTTAFVETILTNVVEYSIVERGSAACQYANSLLSHNVTNDVQHASCENALRMFYRLRLSEPSGTEIVDLLFIKYIEGYAMSSNRVEFANHALVKSNCASSDIRYFTSVTNQLLSSGQPLPWINVGGGDN